MADTATPSACSLHVLRLRRRVMPQRSNATAAVAYKLSTGEVGGWQHKAQVQLQAINSPIVNSLVSYLTGRQLRCLGSGAPEQSVPVSTS